MGGLAMIFRQIASPHPAIHPRTKFYTEFVQGLQREIPSVHSRKSIGRNVMQSELAHTRRVFLRPLIEVDHVDEIDIFYFVRLLFASGRLEVTLYSRMHIPYPSNNTKPSK